MYIIKELRVGDRVWVGECYCWIDKIRVEDRYEFLCSLDMVDIILVG